MPPPLPRHSVWTSRFAHLIQTYQPSPKGLSGRPAHCPFRGLLGVHSRCGLHTRAVTVFRDTLIEGFSHFVTSMTAPIASGWSDCRMGLAPTGKRRLVTAHTQLRHRACIAAIEHDDHSITSSTRTSSISGTVMRSCCAVHANVRAIRVETAKRSVRPVDALPSWQR
jgi:hypothetical protein